MRKIKTITKILYSIVTSLIVISIIVGFSSFFKIKVIETNAKPELLEGLPSSLGDKYIFFIPENKIKKHLLKNLRVNKVRIVRKLPQTIFIEVEYRDETAIISAKNGLFLTDETGFVFEKTATHSSYPLLKWEDREVNLGTNINQKNILKALRIVKLIREKNIRIISLIPLNNEDVSLILDQGTSVIIGSNWNDEEIVSSLQKIFKRFTIEGKILSKIDFRFTKPVISF